MIDRRNYFDLPPGTHPVGVSIWSGNECVARRNYIVRVPERDADNAGFEMTAGDALQPFDFRR
jgi:hypothetical protein